MPSVANYIIRTLRACGGDVVFGYPGQSNILLLRAAGSAGMQFVQTADERSAGFAACGYYMSTGRPAVVCTSKGPGTTNLLTSVVSARKDGVPLIVVTGNVAEEYCGRNAFQEFDAVSAFKASDAVKAAAHCARASELPELLEDLFRAAWTIPYGPVLLDLPYCILGDVLLAEPRTIELPNSSITAREDADEAQSLLRAEEAVKQARRPVIIVGRGAREDWRMVRQFIQAYDIPVVHTIGGTGIVSTEDRLYSGLLRLNGHPEAASVVRSADLVVALGTGLDDRATGGGPPIAPTVIRIQVDIDAAVLQRTDFADIRLQMSVAEFLSRLGAGLERPLNHGEWTRGKRSFDVCDDRPPGSTFLSAVDVVQAVHDELFDAILVKDSGLHKYWATKLAPCTRPEHSIASCHFGSMGFAIPSAIGACIGNPQKTVVAICGDGCLLMSISDLLTAVREKCENLKIVVFNNAGLGSTRAHEKNLAGAEPRISVFGEHCPIAGYADAFGIESYRVTDSNGLAAMKNRMTKAGLVLFDCVIDPTEAIPDLSFSLDVIADESEPVLNQGS